MIDKNDIKNLDVTAESFRGRDNTDNDKSESVINPLAKGDIYEREESSSIALEVTDGNKDINISHLKGDMLTEKRVKDIPAQDEEERKKEAKRQIKEEEKRHQEEEWKKEEEAEVKILKAAIAEQAREDEQPQSSNFTLRKILGGDILSAHLLRNNIWLILVIVGFTIIYISNRYSVQKYLIEIDKLNTELEDAKYRALSSSSQLTEKSRESHILELLKNRKDSVLKMSDRPPYIINVPEK